jgi:hypothetical protein
MDTKKENKIRTTEINNYQNKSNLPHLSYFGLIKPLNRNGRCRHNLSPNSLIFYNNTKHNKHFSSLINNYEKQCKHFR